MRAVAFLVVLFVVTALTPSVSAQQHQHGPADGPRILLQADLPEDGRAWVGHPAHFQYLFLNDDDEPIVHQDVAVKVTLNGVVLYQTEAAHDYDGTGGLDVTFPVPGEYTVAVEIPGGNGLAATYSGYAVPMEDPIEAQLVLTVPESTTIGVPTAFAYHLADSEGNLLPHTDVRVEVRRLSDDFPVLDVHTHSHDDVQSFTYTFERPGPHELRFVGYQAFPSKSAVEFAPVVATKQVLVSDDPTVLPSPPSLPPMASTPAQSAPVPDALYQSTMVADPVTGTEDIVGPFSQVRTTLATRDTETDMLVQHLNYEATLTGPQGVVFESSSLHEYDGALEIMSANQALGTYTWQITVSRGEWAEERALQYDVVPAGMPPMAAGPQHLYARLLDQQQTGAPRHVELFAGIGEGLVPFMHSEVALRIDNEAGLPLLMHKVHTHGSGFFGFDMAYAEAGPHTLQADLFDIHGSATPAYFGPEFGSATRFGYTVADVEPFPVRMVLAAEPIPAGPVEAVPGPALALVLLAGLALLALRRRSP